MLAGRKAFAGPTVADTYVSILEREPDWSALPDQLPGRVRYLLDRCLQKDAGRRRRDIGEVRIEIEEAARELAEPSPAKEDATQVLASGMKFAAAPPKAAAARPVRSRRRLLASLLALFLLMFFCAGGGFLASQLMSGKKDPLWGTSNFAPAANSIAVLIRTNGVVPRNAGPDKDDLWDGSIFERALRAQLTNMLSLEFKVRSPDPSVAYGFDPIAEGRSLNVRAVLSGRIEFETEVQINPPRAVLTLELIDVRAKTILWAEQYAVTMRRTEIEKLVREISTKIWEHRPR
jgi:hypothetical protein